MGLRIIQAGNALPHYFPVEQAATFQPGNIGQLTLEGNQIVCGLSNGTAPFGIIDDIKTNAFTGVSWNETVQVYVPDPVPGPNNTLLTPRDIKVELENPNILPSSFISLNLDVQLIPRNGVVVFPAGTPLNFDSTGDGYVNSLHTLVNYTYYVPNIPGDDSTSGSGRLTIWFTKIIFETDIFDTTAQYPINAPLFVNEIGLLTTTAISPQYPSVGMVLAPPNLVVKTLQALWY